MTKKVVQRRIYNDKPIDYVGFHRCVAEEINITKNQISYLLAGQHRLTEGEQREIILRKVLHARIPDMFSVGRGFICYNTKPSTQIDILITSKNKPTLFKEGDLAFVTPDCVEAIIEVKSDYSHSRLEETLQKLANQVEKIREVKPCWAGLFIYNGPGTNIPLADKISKKVLTSLNIAAQGEEKRVINCVALGGSLFTRFWKTGTLVLNHLVQENHWRSYVFSYPEHQNLAPGYFIGNLLYSLMRDKSDGAEYAHFPIPGVGKEQYSRHEIGLIELSVPRIAKQYF